MNIRRELERRLSTAISESAGVEGLPAIVAPSAKPQFGDYQANGVMAAAKRLKTNPRELAEKVAAVVDISDIIEKAEVAGPGFINITLKTDFLQQQVAASLYDEHMGVPLAASPQTVVVDYSGPNLAKEMHVGHLRSTIIGDALARTLKFLGHNVIRQNHVGDWGTQFGKIILSIWHLCMEEKRNDPDYLKHNYEKLKALRHQDDPSKRKKALVLIWQQHQKDLNEDWEGKIFKRYLEKITSVLTFDDLLRAYQFVNLVEDMAEETDLEIDSSPNHKIVKLAKVSSYITWMLQDFDNPSNEQERETWKKAKQLTLESCDKVYRHLGVLLTSDDVRGESAYNDDLPEVVKDLEEKGLLTESEGAKCVFLDEFKNKDNEPLPAIVQKSDGGYLYATTDLAAIRYRVGKLKADRILYVTDSRQSLHFRQIFAVAKKAGFAPEGVSLEHVPFGMMLGKGGQPFKTREGGTVKLRALLKQAEIKAGFVMDERKDIYGEKIHRTVGIGAVKYPDLPDEKKLDIAKKVGIGAVKYADLSQNRSSDYVFSFDKMLALDGNTAPYMQYAYARIKSIFRKGEEPASRDHKGAEIVIEDPAERALAVKLLQFAEAVETVAVESLPNLLCGYLYDLAGAFTTFYESCPVLKSSEPTRSSRLGLCEATARTIRTGLGLLGIETVEQM